MAKMLKLDQNCFFSRLYFFQMLGLGELLIFIDNTYIRELK